MAGGRWQEARGAESKVINTDKKIFPNKFKKFIKNIIKYLKNNIKKNNTTFLCLFFVLNFPISYSIRHYYFIIDIKL